MGGNSYWQAQFTTTSVVAGNPTTSRADSAALDFTPDCNGPTATLKSVAFGALVADPGGGGRTLKNLRRFDGGAAAINAQLVAPPVFGGGGKLTLEYAGCGKLALKSFVPLSAIGIKGKVTGISDKVAKQLVEISDRGKHAKEAKVKTLSKADRLHNPTPELEPGSASKRQMAGISINYSGTDGRHLVKIAPRPRIVGFVQDCLKDGGKPVFFKSKVDGKRVPAIRCD